ncbi:unnamed protein product [Rotaria sp. Silwood1]|nr:unnamed protein product [Rotaria sp. Silwood1]CAF4917303.1 unnamed protein product [Rotaria sp. Silwood1]CAF4950760.1 unnamed protein product [Rotaria sp. Silwood1]CAF5003247.1 unnamed protein product [Rotaria sp. Silwood1]
MKLTAAQKQKRYRDKLKQNGRHNAMKAKNRARMKIARSKLSDFQREQYRKRDAAAHRSARAAKKFQLNASFNSKQSLGRAVKKVIKYLPQDPSKKKLVIQTIAESIGLLPQSVHKRTSRQLPYKLKEDRTQSYLFEQMKERTDDRKVLLQVDYAENFVMDQQDAIQAAHWNAGALSIFTAHACELKQYFPNLEEITFFSDGAASQFKQRYLFQNLTRMMMEHYLKLSWNFFATSHGKGVVDAIGGIIKRMVWQEIMARKQLCRTATDFVRIANKKTSTIIVHEISQTEIDASKQKLQPLFATTKSVKNTQKLHNVVPIRLDVIECRMYGDAKSKWTVVF